MFYLLVHQHTNLTACPGQSDRVLWQLQRRSSVVAWQLYLLIALETLSQAFKRRE